jgi:ribosomal protein S7
MPYGMRKDEGGDNKENDKWMENCVIKVMQGGKSKGAAIAICKTTFEKAHKDMAKASLIVDKGLAEAYIELIEDD